MTRVTEWPSDRVTEWPSDQVTKWPSDQVTKWPSDQVTEWPSDRKLRRRLTGWYICNIIFRTPVHISAITIFLHFPKTFQFSICVARERKEDDLILSPVTCGIVVNWKKDIKYPFEGQDTITLWGWKLLYYLCLKNVYNGWQQLKCLLVYFNKGAMNVMCYFALSFLQVPPSCDWCNILCVGFTLQIYE